VVSFPQVSPPKPYIRLSSPPIRTTFPDHLILLDFITRTILREEDKQFLILNTDFAANFVAVLNSAARGGGVAVAPVAPLSQLRPCTNASVSKDTV
jgi:hypothetical protein